MKDIAVKNIELTMALAGCVDTLEYLKRTYGTVLQSAMSEIDAVLKEAQQALDK
jgi:hypothetical protein